MEKIDGYSKKKTLATQSHLAPKTYFNSYKKNKLALKCFLDTARPLLTSRSKANIFINTSKVSEYTKSKRV